MAEHPTKRARILIVDDNEATAKVLGLFLSLKGYDTAEAHSGKQALAVAADFNPDVALLDLGIPFMSGFEIAKQFQQAPHLAHTILVAVTGFKGEPDFDKTRAAGFRHYMVKPVDDDTLVNVLCEFGFQPIAASNGGRS
jgi:CheY-like chemotaxis protein